MAALRPVPILMGLLSNLLGRREDPLASRARELVDFSRALAIGVFEPVSGRHPVVKTFDVEHWDFIVTVAAVYSAVTRLPSTNVSDDQLSALMNLVGSGLDEWNQRGVKAFEDCESSFQRRYDQLAQLPAYQYDDAFLAADAIGFWIALNTLGHQPSTAPELELARAVGGLVTHGMFDYWTIR